MSQTNFGVIILTYKRPDRVYTYKKLRDQGYTGKIFLLLDDLDPTLPEYREIYQDSEIATFTKSDWKDKFDIADNLPTLKGVVYARNAVFGVAKSLGLEYFLVLDDDYTDFQFRFDNERYYKYKHINNLDAVFGTLLEFYKNSTIKTLTIAQGGDFIGGGAGSFGKKIFLRRKAMNSFFCSVNRPFEVLGRINEDVNTYVTHGTRGDLYFTTNLVSLQQKETQSNAGGLTEQYKDDGTYVKSFYTVMFSPSSVKICEMGNKNKRLHHLISWKHTTPMILREGHKKVKNG